MGAKSEPGKKILKLNSDEEAIRLFGSLDENLRFAEEQFKVKISAQNYRLIITGSKNGVEQAFEFFQEKLAESRVGSREEEKPKSTAPAKHVTDSGANLDNIQFHHKGKLIRAKSSHQSEYLEAIVRNDIVMCIGPAGTGKTYLAVAQAVDYLKKRKVGRVILTRPAVEAGESLGFLPGDLYAKINPYLRPLYDALYDMLEYDDVAKYLERGIIEVAPLAYMRGRTLSDAFIILDEGQNTTHDQMKMFLTRLGIASKLVITGDITQIDLPGGKKSGLIECQKILKGVKGINFMYLTESDVVRHALVKDIIRAYDRYVP
ncbi:MAG: PhoH family protein [Candidatus Omnitrophica bacterium]|nr:PhoH family protein [Candidatus Omnitrophota bacterium]